MQGRVLVTRQVHNLDLGGSIPPLAILKCVKTRNVEIEKNMRV